MCTSGCSSFAFVPAGHTLAAVPPGCAVELEPTCVEKPALKSREKRKTKSAPSPCQSSTAHTIPSGGGLLNSCLCFIPFAAPLQGGKDALLQPVKLWLWKLFARLSNPACYRLFFCGTSVSVYVFLCRVLCLLLRFGAKALALSAAFSLLRSTAFVVSYAAASTFLSFPAALAALFLFCFFVPLPVVFRRAYRPAIIGTGSLTPQRSRFFSALTSSSSRPPPAKLGKIQCIANTSLSPDIINTAETSTSDIWPPPSPPSAFPGKNSCSATGCVHCSCCSAGRRTQTAVTATRHSFSMHCCSRSSGTDVLLLRSGDHLQRPSFSVSCLQQVSHLSQDSSSCSSSSSLRLRTPSSNTSVFKTCIHAHAAPTSVENTFAGDSWACSSDAAAPDCPSVCFPTAAASAGAPLHPASAASSEPQQCPPSATAQSEENRSSLACTREDVVVPAGGLCCCRHEITEDIIGSNCPAHGEKEEHWSTSPALEADRDCELCAEEKRGLEPLQQHEHLRKQKQERQQKRQQKRQQREQDKHVQQRQQLTQRLCGEQLKQDEQEQQPILLQQQERQRQQLLLECPSLVEGFRPACWALQQRLVQAVLIGAQDVVRLLPLFNFDFSLDVVAADRTLLLLHYLRHRSTADSDVSCTKQQQQQQHVLLQKAEGRDEDCCGCRGIVFVLGGIGARESDAHLQAVCGEAAARGFCCYFLSCLRGIEVPICTRPTDLTVSDDLEAALKVVLRDHCLHSARAAAAAASATAGAATASAAAASASAAAASAAAARTPLSRSIAATAAVAPARSDDAAAASVSPAAVGKSATDTGNCRESRQQSALRPSARREVETCGDVCPNPRRNSSVYTYHTHRMTACEAEKRFSDSSSEGVCVTGVGDASTSPEACPAAAVAAAGAVAAAACAEANRDACRRVKCKKHLYFVAFSMGACIITNFLGRLGEAKMLLLEQQRRQQKKRQQQKQRRGKSSQQQQQNSSQQQDMRQQLKQQRQQQQQGTETQETQQQQQKEHTPCECSQQQQQGTACVSDGDMSRSFLDCTLKDSVSEGDQLDAVETNNSKRCSCMQVKPATENEGNFSAFDGEEQQHFSAAQCSAPRPGTALNTGEAAAREESSCAAATEDMEQCHSSQQEDQHVCFDVGAPPCLETSSSSCSTGTSSSRFLLSVLPLVKGAVTVSNVLCLESSLGFLDVSGSATAWLCRQSIASLYKTRQWKEPCALYRSRGVDEGLIHLSQMAGASSLRALDLLTHLSLCEQQCSAAYYSRVRCVEALLRVPVPLLCLHALDDPVLDTSLLCRVAAAIPKENPNITFVVTEKGGHALFAEDWLLFSRSPRSCYHARVAVEFLEAVDRSAQQQQQQKQEKLLTQQ